MVSAFATPLCNHRWEDSAALNAELEQLILREEAKGAGLARSNVGGWHSNTEFLALNEAAVGVLRGRIDGYLRTLCAAVARDREDPAACRFTLEGWANVLRDGQYHSLHSHPNAAWSGVYYVTANGHADAAHPFSGKLELVDPRPGAGLSYSEGTNLYGRFLLDPVPGQMLVFPGWLQHFVHPYQGGGTRITVAFNATML